MFKRKPGGYSARALLKMAEAGKTAHTSDLRQGKIEWDLTDPTTLDTLRNQYLVERQNELDRMETAGMDRGRREDLPLNWSVTGDRGFLCGKGQSPEHRKAGQTYEEVDVSGLSVDQINVLVDQFRARYTARRRIDR